MTREGLSSRSRSQLEAPKDTAKESREKVEGECLKDGRNGDDSVVAIVGAGFAGLVLANYLEQQLRKGGKEQRTKEGRNAPRNPRWSYKLFESKSSSSIPVIGTIFLESAKGVLEELCLFEEACSEQKGAVPVFPRSTHNNSSSTTTMTTKNNGQYHEVSRESFLELLRKNVPIQSSSRVVDIIEENLNSSSLKHQNNPHYFIVTEGRNGERTKDGPFDLVIAANGLSFGRDTTKALRDKLKFSRSIVRIGDCRYRYGRSWWEFDFLGATRRKRGADIAIRDGLQVGRRLLEQHDSFQETQLGHDLCCKGDSYGKLSLAEMISLSPGNDDGKLLKLVWIAVVVLLPILLALALYN